MSTAAGQSPLEIIAQKEQELRVRMLATRAQADAVLARAWTEAAQARTDGLAAAAAEAREWLERQLEQAHRDAESELASALAHLGSVRGDPVHLEVGVACILDAVLARAAPAATRISGPIPLGPSPAAMDKPRG